LSRQEEVSLFMILLAAFTALLHRYTGQDDILVGSPLAPQTQAAGKEGSGPRANILALRTDLSGNPTFRELLRRIKAVVLGAAVCQNSPSAQRREEPKPSRDLSQPPLFQVMVSLEEGPRQALTRSGVGLNQPEDELQTAQSDLSVRLQEDGSGLRGVVAYNAALFDEATITRLVGHFHTLLEGVVANPAARLATVPLLTGPSASNSCARGMRPTRRFPTLSASSTWWKPRWYGPPRP